jgi:hypothetical protein
MQREIGGSPGHRQPHTGQWLEAVIIEDPILQKQSLTAVALFGQSVSQGLPHRVRESRGGHVQNVEPWVRQSEEIALHPAHGPTQSSAHRLRARDQVFEAFDRHDIPSVGRGRERQCAATRTQV